MAVRTILQAALAPLLDYALPPRCPGCGVVVGAVGTFCTDCWLSIDFIGEPICATCGVDLPSPLGGDMTCGACLSEPPPYDRARAVMTYGEIARTVAHRLKYGRRLSLARVMAEHMTRLVVLEEAAGSADPPLFLPVPLHRWRLWSRGFNQSALIGRHIARRTGGVLEPELLRRVKATPPLHMLSRRERQKIVKGAFALAPGAAARLAGRHVILIDDIWTTGATASACARVLRSAGARRIEVLCWTRVGMGEH
ncbi:MULTISPECIES: ComF family protein [unclassified Sphingobium]|uniref:ComF family protein n=1 Tax=unclassified Sphingobium TaxID=2611147 RepID=UPI002224B64B|nr:MULTISPECIES: ComF family protein [unclassified Sphingobium]MCW2350330.1 ComF family protein [Sphingobium sp. B12D2B]MCW2369434.1 ComF family protein [Sphingobium sp. B11D3D]